MKKDEFLKNVIEIFDLTYGNQFCLSVEPLCNRCIVYDKMLSAPYSEFYFNGVIDFIPKINEFITNITLPYDNTYWKEESEKLQSALESVAKKKEEEKKEDAPVDRSRSSIKIKKDPENI